MATRRTTRRSLAAGSNENDLAARGVGASVPALAVKPIIKPVVAIRTKQSAIAQPKVATSSLTGTRKRSAFADVTNGAKNKNASATSTSTSKPSTSTASSRTRSRTATTGEDSVKEEDEEENDDHHTNQDDEDDKMNVDYQEERPTKQLRRVLVDDKSTINGIPRASTSSAAITTAASRRPALSSKAANTLSRLGHTVTVPSKGPSKASLAARRRREQAEIAAEAAARELEAARREEEEEAEHRAKKMRTSEPEIEYDEEEDDELDEVRVEAEAAERAAAKDEGWEDLDDGDEEDPLMVSAYVVEVYEYLKELELTTMPDVDYMSNQNEVTWKMRGILVDWLIEIHTKFRLLPETIFLATNIIDRFLSVRVVSLVKFQLVGVTALFIAAKYEEVVCPSVSNFLYMTDGGYADDEILKAERYVLGMIDFNLSYPNPINFLRRISKADGYDIASRTMAKYLMEISIVDHKLMGTTPSLIAAAGCWLARKVLDKGYWDANLVHYSGYSEDELKPTAQLMLDYVVSTSPILSSDAAKSSNLNPLQTSQSAFEQPHPNFVKKYAAKKFFKASTTLRKWAEEEYAPILSIDPKTRKQVATPVPAVLQ